MSKVIFIDDEQDILDQYLNVRPKENDSSDSLRALASEFFSEEASVNEDDDKDLASITFLSANQGELGINLIKESLATDSPVQVAFIDMRMPPGIDGKETAKRIRALDSRVEIVIVTAYSDTRPDKFLMEIGTPEKLLYLKKPFDLAEVKQLIRNLTAKYKMERLKEEFISNVTHELKTPLASIVGFGELLLDEMPKDSSLYEYVRVLQSNAQLMRTLVTDLISTLEVSNEDSVLLQEKVDLNSYLDDVHRSLKCLIENGDLDFSYVDLGKQAYVKIDPIRFKQCLYNIIGNAIKFTEKGNVKISLYELDSEYCVNISDTGEGIPEESMLKIFDKFYRVENEHHNRSGLGLGLFITSKILADHLFRYEIKSQVGEGTEFIIYVPKLTQG